MYFIISTTDADDEGDLCSRVFAVLWLGAAAWQGQWELAKPAWLRANGAASAEDTQEPQASPVSCVNMQHAEILHGQGTECRC